MIVDVHAHSPYVEADSERERWVERNLGLAAVPGASTATSTLLGFMRSAGVDSAVCFSYHMHTDRLSAMNRRAVELLAHPELIPFGGIHPDLPDWEGEIRRLKGAGVHGVKIHCNNQKIYPDSQDMFPIYEEIGEDLVVTFHAGGYFLRGDPEVYGTGKRLMRVREAFPRLKMIVAHFGGNYMLHMAREDVIGRDVYVDTAWPPSLRIIGDPAVVAKIIRDHGADRVLFGTDFPLGDPEVYGTGKRLMRVREAFPRLRMIVAHFGGNYMLHMAREDVIGRDVYVDTAWPPSLRIIGDPAVVAKIIRDHGADRVLFGTDFPLGDPAKEIAYIRELPLLTEAEKDKVLGNNAATLFGLQG